MKSNFTFSDFSFDLQVLIRAGEAALDKTKKTQLEALIQDKAVDWDKVYHLACIHQIRPLLLRGVSGMQNGQIPSPILQKLKAACFQISARNLANTNEMLRLLGLFKQQDILAVPYKGAYLANKYYGDFGMREFSDIDLFVHEEDILRIKALLSQEAYIPEFTLLPHQEALFFNTDCEYNFNLTSPEGTKLFHVEPHFRSSHKSYDLNLRLHDFEKHIKDISFSGKNISVLSNEAHLILTTTNHGINEGWTSLKYVFDLYQIMQKDGDTFDWTFIETQFNMLHILPTFLVGYSMLNKLFGLEIAVPMKHLTAEKKIRQLTENRLHKLATYAGISFDSQWGKFLYNVKCRTKKSSQLKMFYYQFATPGNAELKIIILPSWLSFLYIFVRPIRIFRDRVL
jgi:hypothetical protein